MGDTVTLTSCLVHEDFEVEVGWLAQVARARDVARLCHDNWNWIDLETPAALSDHSVTT